MLAGMSPRVQVEEKSISILKWLSWEQQQTTKSGPRGNVQDHNQRHMSKKDLQSKVCVGAWDMDLATSLREQGRLRQHQSRPD